MIDYGDKDYEYNASLICMKCEDFKKMYQSLEPEPKKELDDFLKRASNIKIDDYIKYLDDYLEFLDKYENVPSTRLINIREGDIVDSQIVREIIHKETEIKIKSIQKAQKATRKHSHGKYKSVALF